MPANVEAIDIRRLQVFLEAAKSTNFSSASQVLGMVPSAVSHAIKTLEEEFQCSLFRRNGPRVTLTKAGLRLLPLVEELLDRMARLREEIMAVKGRSQHLRVMMPEIFCTHKLPSILPDFMECFPSAVLDLMADESEADTALDALTDGKTDLLISYCDYDQSRVVKRTLFTETIGIYVAPFHAFASFPPESLRGLGTDPILVPDSLLHRMTADYLREAGTEGYRIWRLPSVQAVLELTRSGQGVAFMPTWVVESAVVEGWLKPLSFDQAVLTRTCSIYHSPKTELGWSAEVFSSLVSMLVLEE